MINKKYIVYIFSDFLNKSIRPSKNCKGFGKAGLYHIKRQILESIVHKLLFILSVRIYVQLYSL